MKNGMVVDENGTKSWYLNGLLHRVDGPAEVWADGTKSWYLNGLTHRVDGPAVEWEDGTKIWYKDDLLHRENGPAVEWADGRKVWYLNGERLFHPESFTSMGKWFEYLNDNENESYQVIHAHNGFIVFINNPSGKQRRVHQMAHVL